MAQTTTRIFALPETILPAARQATNPGNLRAAVPKLVVYDSAGHALNSWDLLLPKGTLGSAESCTICCPLPGIAPLHALLVSGARQAFVRSLAGKLTQDGIAANELLLSDDKCYFEIGGYRFQLLKANPQQAESQRKQAKRMQFAIAKPFSLSSAPEQSQESSQSAKAIDAPWVANVIRQAIEPLEMQIDSLLLPLAEFQSQSLQAQMASAKADEEQRARLEKERVAKEQEIVGIVAQQSATMDTLNERIGDVNQQLSAIERIIAKDAELNSAANAENSKIISVQQSAIEQLQSGMVSVSDSLKQLQERQQAAQRENSTWKNEVQQQLQQLTSAVSEFSKIAEGTDQTALVDAIESLKQTHEVAQLEIGRWQSGVAEQLNHLQETLRDSEAKAQQTEIPAVIAEALAEIQAKHDQSLKELQSWKSELKLEMQQLFQSAAVASSQVASPPDPVSPASAKEIVAASGSTWSAVDPSQENRYPSPSHDLSPARSSHEIEAIDESMLGSSRFIAQDLPSEFEQPVIPEVIDEQQVSQFQSMSAPEIDSAWNADQLQPSNSNDWDNNSSAQDNYWPTLLVESQHQQSGSSLTPPAEQFSDRWSMQSNSDLLENAASEPGTIMLNHQQPSFQPSPLGVDNTGTEYDFDSMTIQVDPAQSFNFGDSELDLAGSNSPAGPGLLQSTLPQSTLPQSTLPQSTRAEEFISVVDRSPAPASTDLDLSIRTIEQALEQEHAAGTGTSLPAWWTDANREEDAVNQEANAAKQEENAVDLRDNAMHQCDVAEPDSNAPSPIPAAFDLSGLYEVSPSKHQAQQDAAIDLSQLQLSPREKSAAQTQDDDGQFFGLGLGEASQPDTQLDSSPLASIDLLAHLTDGQPEPENLFAFAPTKSAEPEFGLHSTAAQRDEHPVADGSVDAPVEDESVEAYMKNLLARMRGQASESPFTPAKPVNAAPISHGPPHNESLQHKGDIEEVEPSETRPQPANSIDLEDYLPLTNPPERTQNISALRELANTNARTAIHRSTRNRTLSGSLMKFAICAIALTVAAALFAINGLAVNVALIATMAALFVALIWGYDGLKSLKPLLQNSLVLQPANSEGSSEE